MFQLIEPLDHADNICFYTFSSFNIDFRPKIFLNWNAWFKSLVCYIGESICPNSAWTIRKCVSKSENNYFQWIFHVTCHFENITVTFRHPNRLMRYSQLAVVCHLTVWWISQVISAAAKILPQISFSVEKSCFFSYVITNWTTVCWSALDKNSWLQLFAKHF